MFFPAFLDDSVLTLTKDILCSLENKKNPSHKQPKTFYDLFLDMISSICLCIYTSWEQDYNSSAFKEKSKRMRYVASGQSRHPICLTLHILEKYFPAMHIF